MTLPSVVRFHEQSSAELRLVGGKGANLGLLARSGYPVPPGFSVTTVAYADFIKASRATEEIERILAKVTYDDHAQVEGLAGEIRDVILTQEFPASLRDVIAVAYAELGRESLVAVRSSGTAEDLDEASFAGLHDTFLGIKGLDSVVEAVQRCWASMWTTRAMVYRHRNELDHLEATIATVIQRMVPSEISGVMFTANPSTTSTDETVIAANWGLGESVVQGRITPDEYVVKSKDVRLIEKTLGTKTVQILPDPATGTGTVEVPVAADQQGCFTLSNDQAAELTRLGRRVQELYGGIPQDVEWALADGQFWLLQSRPLTGVEFTWDAEIDAWQTAPEIEDTTWTRALADSDWTGAVTPLFYSYRARGWQWGSEYHHQLTGLSELVNMRFLKYHKAEVYYNADLEKAYIEKLVHPALRPYAAEVFIPPAWVEEVINLPFHHLDWLKAGMRMKFLSSRDCPQGPFSVFRAMYDKYLYPKDPANWGGVRMELPDLNGLDDRELVRFTEDWVRLEQRYFQDIYPAWVHFVFDLIWLMRMILERWYDGPKHNLMLFAELLSGSDKTTMTAKQNVALMDLAERIQSSPELLAVFQQFENGPFFSELAKTEDGSEWLEDYRAFAGTIHAAPPNTTEAANEVALHSMAGYRGHNDRDIYYARRCEDPSIDYRALQVLVGNANSEVAREKEAEVNERRHDAYDDVVENLRKKSLGAFRAEIFKFAYEFIHTHHIPARDDERSTLDRHTYLAKVVFLEISRRLVERRAFDRLDDVFFLSKEELYEYFEGRGNPQLVKMKIKNRRAVWDRFNARVEQPPKFLQRNRPVELGPTDLAHESTGVMHGLGRSRGVATGTARIVKSLDNLDQVRKGEILVCNSTDPGWTPVFLTVAGVVTETGGLLSHASCLCREYGLPNVELTNAMARIPDGATITVDGSTGVVSVVDDAELAQPVG